MSLTSEGTAFVAYLDSKSKTFVRHPTLSAQELARWSAAKDWSGMQLLCQDAEFGHGDDPKPIPSNRSTP